MLFQPVKGLLYPREGQGQVHADVAGPVEGAAILPGHAHVPSGLLQLVDGGVVGGAPVGAVQKQHVGALGLGNFHPGEVLGDKAAGEIYVAGDGLPQLVHPVGPFLGVGANQGVHGQHVHGVVVREGAFLVDALPQGFVVDNVVAADEPRQVEGLGGGVESYRALAGVLRDGLQGNVLVAL